MKGVVFTELCEFVENNHSPEFLQQVINDADLPSKGAYTASGAYSPCELHALVSSLSGRAGIAQADILRLFGRHMFSQLASGHPEYLSGVATAFDFLSIVEDYIHHDVRKLYPDAELPKFDVLENRPDRFRMVYASSRHLGDFCEGLILGCLDHFEEEASIIRRTIATAPESVIEFTLEKAA